MIGKINNPKRWPHDEPATHEQLRQIDKTLPAFGPDSHPWRMPTGSTHDGKRLATRLNDAVALEAGEPTGMRSLL